ncbi:2-dehydropantoate 2-reductase [Mastigocoleus sp. MO_188.B34]|uniref:2-dehydropantoate 2-reductase n=1 Tax=Mastigocoleus sp. MO_188.B34 TaxID=3036635 RepID=UPI002606068E|nr:2-dehydropantoate 2-reductase [Mastigocoleus sp. MO_188.B34]MDJ0694530.1 2-dehydropantoate 2-reductase [Mastigocoleus sp. MO_188.B34]
MKICIFGAGAIGSYLGAKLAKLPPSEVKVTFIARGKQLKALQTQGLQLEENGVRETTDNFIATADVDTVGPQDAIFVTVKAQSVPKLAPSLPALYGSETMVVTAQNGIPWWYFRNSGTQYEDRKILTVDPDGVVEANIPIERVIGCIVYPATELIAPGVVKHIEGDRFTLGELDGSKSDRIKKLVQVLRQAGLKAPVRNQIRNELWLKLWGNLAFNPISAITRATLEDICKYSLTRELARNMMLEGQVIAEKLGVKFSISLEQRIEGASSVGAHKTSMLQDIEAGRPTEIDALLGAVIELGKLTDTRTPHLNSIYASVKLLEKGIL